MTLIFDLQVIDRLFAKFAPADFTTLDRFEEILKQYWGYNIFRSIQRDIIESVYNGNDTLALMPTGGGKSITFQVPALALEGTCLVITPLIALMKDQVENLKKRDIRAVAVHSGLTRHEVDVALDNCAYGDVKFLYLSPERTTTELFRERLRKIKVSMVAVDESHCISQWGYDFRPSYLRIAELREIISEPVPFLALTATATPEVVEDIQQKLKFRNGKVFSMSFARENLVYLVRNVEDKPKHLLKITHGIPGSGIVYVRSRSKTREIAQMLQKEGISADFYHAGLTMEVRNAKQNDWQVGKTRVIVATNAFGMGIDKPDVRFVVHVDLPDSPEAYFQEAGRAGRDQKLAYAVLLFNNADSLKIEQRVESNFPPIEEIKRTYQALGSYLNVAIGAGKGETYDFNLMDFCSAYKLSSVRAYSSLKILEREGYLELTDELDNPSRIMFLAGKQDLYKFQVAHAELDGFIKAILRNFTGVFSQYVRIDEVYLARLAGITVDKVIENLKTLGRYKIISYIPKKRTPLLVLVEERLDDKNLRIEPSSYRLLRSRFEDRVKAMLSYANNQSKCRSQMLSEYFGQKDSYRCGKCDVCTSRNELDMSKYEFDMILDGLKRRLQAGPCSEEELIDAIKRNPDRVARVIKYLMDTGKIFHNEKGMLAWHHRKEGGFEVEE
ncbi:MAG: RecQ family ATP-dependent DNA helicase [Bacteroidales bacterium]|jgi:ATP-dependent DNA helicase RecQ|nr:RecQ family ATP-dependent DNA helicase [Bacteroidales bacterium]HNT41200.1 ATP-dependent DNA helicase RecQ [Tenuifilaceae bacterium]MBP8642726.1 RecQ family ATP-dependent DNA helicase [Bacteroidales bacterium]NLI87832.1 RecQ family ATP-dependent DNA helicase [Bacteroidales bacterium]HOA08891.1 ATP-dependent DNA helicase RecQ [Tenuifilaceae bacterium]